MISTALTVILSSLQEVVTHGATYLKYWFTRNPVTCQCTNRVRSKIVVITGPTGGIGYCTALDLAKKGSVLYLACRNCETGEETAAKLRKFSGNQEIYFLPLDLTQLSTIRNFVDIFKRRESTLDILINNAAIFHHPSTVTDDGIEITFQTNYLGLFYLTTLLQDIIPKAESSRILFLSSEAHRLVTTEDLDNFNWKEPAQINSFNDYVNLYGISKLAVHVYASHLTKHIPEVLVVLINPGNVWTDIYRNCWRSWGDLMIRTKCAFFMRDPEEGAQSSIHAINAPKITTGTYITDTLDVENLEDYCAEVSNRLMTNSKIALGLSDKK